MSGPGQGYNYGHYAPQSGYAQPAQGDAQHSYDPYAPQQHQQQQQQDPYAPYQTHDHGMNTVYEEDEPAPSPEMNRNGNHAFDNGYQQQQGQGQYGQQGGGGGYDYSQQQQYAGYDQEQQQYGQSSTASSDAASQQQQEQQYDVPVYPGWVYNPSTNSYDPDPNYQGEGGAGETRQESGTAAGEGQDQQGEYGGYEQQAQGGDQDQGYGGYGQRGGAEQEQYGGYDATGSAAGASGDDYYAQYDQQQQSDPYAQDAQGQAQADPCAAQADPYANETDPYAQEQEDPYAADSNPYAEEGQQQDPFSAASHGGEADPFAAVQQQQPNDPYAPSSQQNDPYAAYQPAVQQQQQAPAPAAQQQQQQQYDPYAPPSARGSSFSPPPQQSAPRSDAYSPPPSQQQYNSFAAAYEQSAPAAAPAQQSAPHDPYAPPPRQPQQQRARSGTASSTYDPYAPTSQLQQQQGRERSGTATSSYDPYAPAAQQQQQAYDPYAAQRQPPAQQPLSPPTTHSPLPRTAQQQAASSPPLTRSAFSPPPRSPSAASSASARRGPASAQPQGQSGAPAGRQQATLAAPGVAPPRSSSAQSNRSEAPPPAQAPAQAAPPPKAAAPPLRANGAGAAPPPRSSGAAFDIPPPRQAAAPPARRQPPPQQQQRQPEPEPEQEQEAYEQQPPKQQPPPARQPAKAVPSAVGAYAPPPPEDRSTKRDSYGSATSSTSSRQSVLPPSQRGMMQPPSRRAPHQRGASAFGSDSPYGALPTGPPSSAYEPPQTVGEIKEEEEEEEEEQRKVKEEEVEPEKPEDVVPSWMQAAEAAPARGPYFPNQPSRPAQQPPVKPAQSVQDDVADSLQNLSLNEKKSPQQTNAPLPPRGGQAAPPPRQPQQAGGAPPPPRQAQGAPPPRAAGGPPPRTQQQQQAPPSAAPPPARGAPPPRAQPPARPPQQQQQQYQPAPPLPQQQQQGRPRPPISSQATPDRSRQVPQLNFQAPSPDVRSDRGQMGYDLGGRRTPQPMSGIEETPEEYEQDEPVDYFGENAQQQQQDDSTAYTGTAPESVTEEGTGATTPSSAYGGDWKADSENTGGYDYVNHDRVGTRTLSQQQKPYDPYAPSQQPHDPYAPSTASSTAPHDPYAPASVQQGSRAPHPQQQQKKPHDPYAPPQNVPSRESTFTPPAQQRGAPPPSFASPSSRSRFGEPAAKPATSPSVAMARANSYNASPARTLIDSYAAYPPQGLQGGPYSAQAGGNLTAPAAYGSFAPQQGQGQLSRKSSFANNGESADLGLERRTAPVVSFGLGGRMVVVFPSNGQPGYSVDSANPYAAAGAGQQQHNSPSAVHIRKLVDILPPSTANEESATPFPGPIFLDGGKANAGKKRKEAVAWLTSRIAEVEQEVQYAKGAVPPGLASGGEQEAQERRRKAETKLLLLKLVNVMIDNEGKLTGSPKVDDAVRAIFAPDSTSSTADDSSLPTADQLAAAASRAEPTTGSDAPFVTYSVSPAHLDQMQSFLLRSERREAVRYALDNKMWAHAFIIASCVDTDCWKDVTVEFLRSELTPGPENAAGGAEGREALRVAYSMFAGLGAESIHQFVPPRSLGPQAPSLLPPASIGGGLASAPLSRVPTETNNGGERLSEATLEKWQDTVGMIVANRTAGDSAALTALGDALAANGWVAAAHVCYLLSPQTSLATVLGTPGSRIVLVGSTPFLADGSIDLESVKLTELVEFALSLTPTIKGHESFVGFPHLQAFRLYHAAVLADQGQIGQALKYTEAVVNTLKLATKPSPFYHPVLVAQIKALSERLGAAPGQKESKSWIASKVPRPTVNSLWSTFEGGFNKFVSGDSEPTPQQLAAKAEVAKTANGAPVGPFSHYSSISPGSTSGTLSRAQSSTDLASSHHLQAIASPVRPLSATGPASPLVPPQPTQQPHPSPGPPPVKRAPYKGHHARSSSLGAFAGYDYNPNAPPPWQAYTPPAAPGRQALGASPEKYADTITASHKADMDRSEGSNARRPQFAPVEERFQEDDSGFINPMAQFTPSVSPAPNSARTAAARQEQTHRRMTTAEELADLGIGNSKSKKPAFDTLDEELEAQEGGMTPTERTPAPEDGDASRASPANGAAPSGGADGDKPTIKPSKSWLGGWFKREASPAQQGPGPIKAKLGEEKSFYYDEKLKRWVNKTGKGGEEAPAAVVPPPRAATASPSRGIRNGPPRFSTETPPLPPMPPRSATTGPPPLSRSATSADLRLQAQDSRTPPTGPPTRPPSAGGAMPPPRSAAGTPLEGSTGRAGGAKRKPKHAHLPAI
ncbi:hypothetical protein JCM8547_007735 [Rhodosporidiobolus lusitaniae]